MKHSSIFILIWLIFFISGSRSEYLAQIICITHIGGRYSIVDLETYDIVKDFSTRRIAYVEFQNHITNSITYLKIY